MDKQQEVIGLIPAGGRATRIAPLPCSKELYPIGFRSVDQSGEVRPKVVCHYLLEKMKLAGVKRAFFVLNSSKWDIPTYLGDGTLVGLDLAYVMMGNPFGPPYTLDQAFPFVRNETIAFGFPDILFKPDDAFIQLLAKQNATKADVILGLFPAHDSRQMDMVDLHSDGRIRSILLKPLQTDLLYAWVCAVWSPAFTSFMHQYLAAFQHASFSDETLHHQPAQAELSVGAVLQAAIQQGLQAEGVLFHTGTYVDIGTPEGLRKALQASC